MIETNTFACKVCGHIHSTDSTFLLKEYRCSSLSSDYAVACDLHSMGLHSRQPRRIDYIKALKIARWLRFNRPYIRNVSSISFTGPNIEFRCSALEGERINVLTDAGILKKVGIIL